jgi:hypothetical protein
LSHSRSATGEILPTVLDIWYEVRLEKEEEEEEEEEEDT